MNRQMKRMQERAERQQKRSGVDRQSAPAATARRAQAQEKRKRTGALQFLKEVRQELRKVDWPNRRELVSYTVVVLATLVVMTAFVATLDFAFLRVVVDLFG